jgi:hypothetical protein
MLKAEIEKKINYIKRLKKKAIERMSIKIKIK